MFNVMFLEEGPSNEHCARCRTKTARTARGACLALVQRANRPNRWLDLERGAMMFLYNPQVPTIRTGVTRLLG